MTDPKLKVVGVSSAEICVSIINKQVQCKLCVERNEPPHEKKVLDTFPRFSNLGIYLLYIYHASVCTETYDSDKNELDAGTDGCLSFGANVTKP